MLKIQIHNKLIENFSGVACINVDNTTAYLRKLYEYENDNRKVFNIGGNEISIEDFMIISPLTTLDSLYSFTNKNILNKIIGEHNLDTDKLINKNYLQNIANKVNKKIGYDLVNINESTSKLFKSMFDIKTKEFITSSLLYSFLRNISQAEKQNIIIKDMDDISLSLLTEFSNDFNIIVMTNNSFNIIKSSSEVLLTNFVDENLYTLKNIDNENVFEYFIEEYFQKPFDNVNHELIYTKETMENMKKALFLK
ncbi:hypothetical protein MCANUFG4_01576 [Mycoplasmopsis canis UFG4]|uniref:Uncharacterized protein n=1 Tax=Mycoplasmopsis canis UFG4 TaxID=1131455 RepID=I1A5G6_9BACT|nr:hypothetical protein [Mycoplasmopsis canis]EIE40170.1 hypothetical protein MCANUF33_01616 [Mycoplasmopsis canis UF33]EIE41737.1 hypothetical protein MCANUFG4_01576 [Mycoplasmopsis canis UFG4]